MCIHPFYYTHFSNALLGPKAEVGVPEEGAAMKYQHSEFFAEMSMIWQGGEASSFIKLGSACYYFLMVLKSLFK